MGEPDAIAVARSVARRMGRAWGVDPRELLGAAWQGAASARPGCPPRVAAARQVVDYVRQVTGHRWGSELPIRPATGLTAEMVPDRPPGPAERLAELWAETAPARRRHAPLRARVFLYLVAVEGLSVPAAAAAMGVTPSAGAMMLIALSAAAAGRCQDCPAPAAPGYVRCDGCRRWRRGLYHAKKGAPA